MELTIPLHLISKEQEANADLPLQLGEVSEDFFKGIQIIDNCEPDSFKDEADKKPTPQLNDVIDVSVSLNDDILQKTGPFDETAMSTIENRFKQKIENLTLDIELQQSPLRKHATREFTNFLSSSMDIEQNIARALKPKVA